MAKERNLDVAVVGAGIVGLSHALAAARKGLRVGVFERGPLAQGASIRNFGMVWPVGQPKGALADRAFRSRAIWDEVLNDVGIPLERVGSIHLAYHDDEMAVLEEFVAARPDLSDSIALLTPEAAMERSPAVRPEGLKGAMISSSEAIVDPRAAIAGLAEYLAARYEVAFHFKHHVSHVESGRLSARGEEWTAERIYVCSGADFESLFPESFEASNLTRVKLQMMRTRPQPDGFRLGPAICGGLTLIHSGAFAEVCSSLSALKDRYRDEMPFYPEMGIQVMVSQNPSGELVIGDSHEYGDVLSPFDRYDINSAILEYLKKMVQVPDISIAETWHGVYCKSPGNSEWIEKPVDGVTVVTGLSGSGMTLSFGLGEEVVGHN